MSRTAVHFGAANIGVESSTERITGSAPDLPLYPEVLAVLKNRISV